ncbi:hypothetical protein DICPUDRAFT_157681 [Dictyostelium purpureum]|uniref:Uncharacterized protein n=1 Tax=Dictyostelium purpureum TaxID=5786 RepID=F0ZZQ7_DICPU|nr:uncharacterized protein DICPUDRAFT_157681 [Dictyostelium purpureum]EGC30577.1 hypothetical protein DICPUDRAFT_157681 [Dictyostelium purpureum]|eukprot:XP_003292899.1 hypothetical protein DICPUDRAFT_157681 [Dictyostelium purpureum]
MPIVTFLKLILIAVNNINNNQYNNEECVNDGSNIAWGKIVPFLVLFFVNSNNFVVSQAPRCITTENVYQGDARNKYNGMIPTKDVDWWFLQQLSGEDGGAIYTDSYLSGVKIISEINNYYTKNNNNIPNPVTKTYEQILGNNNYNSIVYNNEPRPTVKKVNGVVYNDPTTSDDPGKGAHAKGFFIWNNLGGIHVIHSYPKSPVRDGAGEFFDKGNEQNLGQHSVCINLSSDELDIIPKLLIYGDFIINAINGKNLRDITNKLSSLTEFNEIRARVGPLIGTDNFSNSEIASFGTIKKTFDQFDLRIFKTLIFDPITNHWSKNSIQLLKWSTVAKLISNKDFSSFDFTAVGDRDCIHYNKVMDQSNGDGQYFVQTSNNYIHEKKAQYPLSKRGFNMIWDYIADYYYNNHQKTGKWLINTMQKGGEKNKNQMAKPSDKMNLVSRTDAPWSVSEYTTDGAQHSKISYLVDSTGNLFCIGDLNWQGKQESRGGCAFCSKKLDYLAEYYERRVTVIADPPVTPAYQTFGPEVIPFGTAGFKIDFTGIYSSLENNGFYPVAERPVMEIKKLNQQNNQYESFNPKVIIDTETTKPSVDYGTDGSLTYNNNIKIKNFNSLLKGIYIPMKLKNIQTATRTFEIDQKIGLFLSPILKDEIIFCDFDDPHCDYNHNNHLLIKDLAFRFQMEDYAGITQRNQEAIGQTRNRKINVIFRPTISNSAPLSIIDETIALVKLEKDIKTIYQYFGIVRQTPIRFINVDVTDKDIQRILIEDRLSCGNGDIIYYNENCYDFLVYCLSENFAVTNNGIYNHRVDGFSAPTDAIMGAIVWPNGTPSTCFIPDEPDMITVYLKEYANKLGIVFQGNKRDIYDKIKEFIELQQRLSNENQEKESINSFNKERAQLTIKDIEPHEYLFWEIFRNKTIYKEIFSNFKPDQISRGYESICRRIIEETPENTAFYEHISLAQSASCSSINSCNSNESNGSSCSSGCNNKNSNGFLINNGNITLPPPSSYRNLIKEELKIIKILIKITPIFNNITTLDKNNNDWYISFNSLVRNSNRRPY